MSARGLSLVPERQPEDAGEPLEPPPLSGVRPTRYVLPAREAGAYWGYEISEYHRICDRLTTLTPAELKLVAKRVDELLGK